MKKKRLRPTSRLRTIIGLSLIIVYSAISAAHADSTKERLTEARNRAALKEYTSAIEIYDSVLAVEPENLEALNGKARVLGWAKEYEDAEMVYLKGLSIAPHDVESLTGLADIYAWQGAHDKSIRLLEGELDEHTQEKEVLLRLARYHYWAGHKNESLYYTGRLLDADSTDKDAIVIRSGAVRLYTYEHYGGYYHLNINNNETSHNAFYGLKYKPNKKIMLYGRFDYLDRFSETEGRFLGGSSLRVTDDLSVSAELSFAPGALVFPVVAGRAEIVYITKQSLILYGALNFSNYKSTDLIGISATGELYVTDRSAFISRISLVRTEFRGAKSSTTTALLIKAIQFLRNSNEIFTYFSYGNESYLIETIDRIGDVNAKAYGIGTTFSITSAGRLSPRIEIQDREGGSKYVQSGLEFNYRW